VGQLPRSALSCSSAHAFGHALGNAFVLLSIVLPVLKEAQAVPLLLARLQGALRELSPEVIFVDDGTAA
jgi:hypothetical protein